MTPLSSFSEQYWSSPAWRWDAKTYRLIITHARTHTSLETLWHCLGTQSVCVSKHDWHPRVGGHWGQWSEKTFFPAIIKQFNWICSYAGELLVWISISMPSHKSYFQVHWALSSAKLIPHDMPWGLARCFLYTEDILTDTSVQVPATVTRTPCSLQAFMLQFTTQSWNMYN